MDGEGVPAKITVSPMMARRVGLRDDVQQRELGGGHAGRAHGGDEHSG